MNTHDIARQLAFYRTSAPPHIGYSWDQFEKDTGLPSGVVDKLEEGTDALLQTGFDVALDELIKLTTNNKYNLTNVKSAPLDVRLAIVKAAEGVTEGLGHFAANAILFTVQDEFYEIAGKHLNPKYDPVTMCCAGQGKKTYAQVLELLKKLSSAKKTQIVLECYAKSQAVGAYAKDHLELGVSEPVVGSTAVKPLTPAQKMEIIKRTINKLDAVLLHYDTDKYFLDTQVVKNILNANAAKHLAKLAWGVKGHDWYKTWKAEMDRRKRLVKIFQGLKPYKPTNQKFTMSTGMKWATGLLGAVTIVGTLYLMSDD